jgi:uncharacterized FlaG/YvyC family protein
MKAATINELKQELAAIAPANLLDICLRLAKFKKENKELLTYLLFEAGDEPEYIRNVKNEIELQFADINKSNVYFAKKSLRKILRSVNKYIRYTASKEAEVHLLMHYCLQLKNAGIPFQTSTALTNLYQAQIKKIEKTIATLEDDLQYDYNKELKQLLLQ